MDTSIKGMGITLCRITILLMMLIGFSTAKAEDYSFKLRINYDETNEIPFDNSANPKVTLDRILEGDVIVIIVYDSNDEIRSLLGVNHDKFHLNDKMDLSATNLEMPYTISDVSIILDVSDINKIKATFNGNIPVFVYGTWNDDTRDWKIRDGSSYNTAILKESQGNWIGEIKFENNYGNFFRFRCQNDDFVPVAGSNNPNLEEYETQFHLIWSEDIESITLDFIKNSSTKYNYICDDRGTFYFKLHFDKDEPSNGEFTISKVPFETEDQPEFKWDDDKNGILAEKNFTYGDEDNKVYYTIADGKEVDFTVMYRKPSSSKSNEITARRVATQEEPVVDEDGYTKATNETEYTLDTDEKSITLNLAGDYKITPQFVNETTTVEPLKVTVAQKPVTLALTTEAASQAFGTSGTTTFSQLFSFTQELTYDDDFTVSVKPADGYEDWPSTSDNLSYEEALNKVEKATLWDQYQKLGENVTVDGFFTSKEDVKVSRVTGNKEYTPDGKYYYDLAMNVPCSGLYTISVDVSDNYATTEGSNTTYEVAVYPNLAGKFGKEYGFNISGYTFVENEGNSLTTIHLPANMGSDQLKNAVAYIPGTYFATPGSFSVSTSRPDGVNETKRKANSYDYAAAPWMAMIDLTSLDNSASSEGIPLYVEIAKNGASYVWEFSIAKGGNVGTVTGLDVTQAEENGEAVYYTLQGVQVQNPERGVYIKVSNGKATKVAL